jgi:hypothetical protein
MAPAELSPEEFLRRFAASDGKRWGCSANASSPHHESVNRPAITECVPEPARFLAARR